MAQREHPGAAAAGGAGLDLEAGRGAAGQPALPGAARSPALGPRQAEEPPWAPPPAASGGGGKEAVAGAAPEAAAGCRPRKGGGLRCPGRRDPMIVVGVVGVASVLLMVVVGVVLQLGLRLNSGPGPGALTPCTLERLGYDPAIATSSWDPASPQWLFGVGAVGTYVLRRHALACLAGRFYGHLPASKQAKVANYMLELLGTSAALGLCAWAGFFDLLVRPGDFEVPDAGQAYRLAAGAQQLYMIFVVTYLTELSFDPEMRLGLRLHHWTSIVLAVWGAAAVSIMHGDRAIIRGFFAISLYMSTEQSVFVEMLLYQRRVYWPRLYYASAWYYFASRAAILAISFRTWWQMYDHVFGMDLADSWVVYSLWLFMPVANLILTATQVTTLQSLLGIAASVRERAREAVKRGALQDEARKQAEGPEAGRARAGAGGGGGGGGGGCPSGSCGEGGDEPAAAALGDLPVECPGEAERSRRSDGAVAV